MLTAGHHIGLLLLSTAAVGSREHREIIQSNSPGIWLALSQVGLVERDATLEGSEQAPLWRLSERGCVLVDHVLALPLPEMAWRMPGVVQQVMPVTLASRATPFTPPSPLPGARWFTEIADAPEASSPAPKPHPVSMLPKIDIPTDPAELRTLADQLLDQGYGMMEVAQMLKLEESQMQGIFYGGTRLT